MQVKTCVCIYVEREMGERETANKLALPVGPAELFIPCVVCCAMPRERCGKQPATASKR